MRPHQRPCRSPKTPGTGPAFRLPFDNSFFRDMQGFDVPWKPEPSPAPAWVQFNDALALELGLGAGDAEVCDRSGVAVRRGNAG